MGPVLGRRPRAKVRRATKENGLPDVERETQRDRLRDVGHDRRALLAVNRLEVGLVPMQGALRGRIDARDGLDERRLARAIGTQQAHKFAAPDVETDVTNYRLAA